MSENVIFCFSGTGNCLDIAKNIAKRMGDTDIIMMRKAPAVTDVRGAKRVGFVFPCYAGGLPGDVEKYVKTLKIDPKAYTFGVCSYAGYIGCGLHKLNAIVPLNYWAGISHQCSCIWLFPHTLMMPPISPAKAQKRSEEKALQIAIDALSFKRRKEPPKMSVNAVESAAWPVLSKLKGRKLKAGDACIGCGQCAKLCPKGNITIVGGKAKFGKDCLQCLSCLQYCPKQAISMGGPTETRERYHNPNVTPDELTRSVIHFD